LFHKTKLSQFVASRKMYVRGGFKTILGVIYASFIDYPNFLQAELQTFLALLRK